MAVVEKTCLQHGYRKKMSHWSLWTISLSIRAVQVYASRKALSSMYFTDSACVLTRHTKSSL